MSRFQQFLLRTASKLTGSAVTLRRYRTAKIIPSYATFDSDPELERRLLLKREMLKAAGVTVKALR